ncbi:MAG: hypothetical protein EPO31_01280 [Gammaproteobacteria bacterium]|nr:MAG: hypothetical protein EPO31_01280 [Gammaproteobacteria bacterium]
MITYGGPALFVAAVVVIITPLLYVLALKRFRLGVKIAGIVALWTLAIFVAYWDVYQISKEARRLCKEEAGLHVYKTVEAEGFLGYATDIEYWSEYGFKYVEGLYKNNKTRLTLQNGEIVRETIPEYVSRYQYVTDSKVLTMPFVQGKDIIKDRETDEILGEIVAFTIYPGWLDSRLLGLLGFTWIPPRCDGDYPPERGKRTIYFRDLIKVVIKPTSSDKGERQ